MKARRTRVNVALEHQVGVVSALLRKGVAQRVGDVCIQALAHGAVNQRQQVRHRRRAGRIVGSSKCSGDAAWFNYVAPRGNCTLTC